MHFQSEGSQSATSSMRIRSADDSGYQASNQQVMPNDPLLGRVIDNKYRIDAEIGSGGMATIYRATRLQIGDNVAIKILHSEFLRDPKFTERFQREAQAAARLKHPNAVTIHDFGVSEGGIIYLVMELVEGQNLRTIIKGEGPMTTAAAAAIIRQVCAALTEAHRQNIIHRDIKPANIAVTTMSDGIRVKVLDFGIASLRGGTMMTLTQAGDLMGTPAYMSPEQCLGEELDSRSDIYSLGVVLFEMLSGTVPFNSPTVTAVVMQHVQQAPPPLRVLNASVSAPVEAVVLRALAKRREDRQQSAKELADDLSVAVAGATASGGADDATIVAPGHFSASQVARTMIQGPMPRIRLNATSYPPLTAPLRGRGLPILITLAAVAILGGATWFGVQQVASQRPNQVASSARPTIATANAPAITPQSFADFRPESDGQVDSPLTSRNMLPLLRGTAAITVATESNGVTAYVTVPETPAEGTANPATIRSGRMADGRWVGIVPLDSGGPARVVYALMWVWTNGQAQFVGEIPAENNGFGHLSMIIEDGQIDLSWPVFAPSDRSCCPSRARRKLLTLSGVTLRPLSDQII